MTSQTRIIGRRVALEVLADHELDQVSGGGPYDGKSPGTTFCCNTSQNGYDFEVDDCAP